MYQETTSTFSSKTVCPGPSPCNSDRGSDYGGGGGKSSHRRCTSYFAPKIASAAQSINGRPVSPFDNSAIDVSLDLG